MKIVKSKTAKGLCRAYRCAKKKAQGRNLCHKHKARRQKEVNNLSYTFSLLKQNAKRRGKVFLLTLQDFEQFCFETNYMQLKGGLPTSASIDRIDPSKGYEVGNLQILSLSSNSQKRWEEEPF